jgi:hypothetical protein
VAVAYVGALRAGYVGDDRQFIVESPLVTELAPLPASDPRIATVIRVALSPLRGARSPDRSAPAPTRRALQPV